MGWEGRKRDDNRGRDRRWEYLSCDRKKKLKSNEASKLADRWDQRKYLCHLCGHWHLTKKKGER